MANYDIDQDDILNFRCPVAGCEHLGVESGICPCHALPSGLIPCREHGGVGIYAARECPVLTDGDDTCGQPTAAWASQHDVLIAVCDEHAEWVRIAVGGYVHPLAMLAVERFPGLMIAARHRFGDLPSSVRVAGAIPRTVSM